MREFLVEHGPEILTAVVATVLSCVVIWMVRGPLHLLWQRWQAIPRKRRAYYVCAAKKVFDDQRIRAASLHVIRSREFFDEVALDDNLTKHDEMDMFSECLATELREADERDVRNATKKLFAEIHNSLRSAAESFFQNLAKKWDHEERERRSGESPGVAAPSEAAPDSSLRPASTVPGFMTIVLTDSESYREGVARQTEQFFGEARPRIQPVPEWCLAVTGKQDADAWKLLLGDATRQLRELCRSKWEVHVTFGTRALWNFALGVFLKNRTPLVLYHWQDGTYHRIWKIDRSVKDLRSPLAEVAFEYRFCGEPCELRSSGESDDPAEALIFDIGANEIGPDVLRYLDSEGGDLAKLPVSIVKKRRKLEPQGTDDWIRCAAELAYTVDRSGAQDLYLFVDMPTVLALMVGDALGPYISARVHLMQRETGTYRELLVLPDSELDDLVE